MYVRTIPKTFKKHGYDYELHTDAGNGYRIYAQKKKGKVCAYEVIKVLSQREAITPKGYLIEEGERYPKTSEWGLYGWTYLKLENAQAKLELLSNQSKEARVIK